jgi:hypothetical protein
MELLPQGGVVEAWGVEPQGRQPRQASLRNGQRVLSLEHPQPDPGVPANPLQLHAGEGWIMLAERHWARRSLLASIDSGQVHAVIHWPEGSEPRVRSCGQEWLMFDGTGRLLRLDAASGASKGITLR